MFSRDGWILQVSGSYRPVFNNLDSQFVTATNEWPARAGHFFGKNPRGSPDAVPLQRIPRQGNGKNLHR